MIKNRIILKTQKNLWLIFFLLLVVIVLVATRPEVTFAAATGRLERISTTPQPAVNVESGRQLFMGEHHFQNGGPPCMGCHNINSNGFLGGGTLGPDLTDVSSRYTHAELAQTLADISSPTMKPIFSGHPLTPQEQADLLAFLEASDGQPITDREPLLFGLSLVGLVMVTGLFGFMYRNRLRSVRKSLVKKSLLEGQGK